MISDAYSWENAGGFDSTAGLWWLGGRFFGFVTLESSLTSEKKSFRFSSASSFKKITDTCCLGPSRECANQPSGFHLVYIEPHEVFRRYITSSSEA